MQTILLFIILIMLGLIMSFIANQVVPYLRLQRKFIRAQDPSIYSDVATDDICFDNLIISEILDELKKINENLTKYNNQEYNNKDILKKLQEIDTHIFIDLCSTIERIGRNRTG